MFNLNKGLLGLNARNLLYIKEYNKQESINFADSKLKTKHYLSARGIPVPKLYSVIRSHEELNNFDFGSLPGSVVLKPNRGSGGEGIIAFKERHGSKFITVDDEELEIDDLKAHIIDIIDGRFSLNHTRDIAFFEQRIITNKELQKYTYQGLPDVRVIVYNLIPVMVMLRIPTKESHGKANLAQGAVGVGIDIATGKPTHIAYKNKIVKEIPDMGKFEKSFSVPFFDEILLIASKCQSISNVGFLACDVALEDDGPILLELNARAGLKVQIANKAPLRKRLEQIHDIKVKTPEKGIRVAKDLFGKKDIRLQPELAKQKIIGLEEFVELILPDQRLLLKAKINPAQNSTTISEKMKELLEPNEENKAKIKLNIKGQKFVTVAKVEKIDESYGIIIGRRDLQNFLIDTKKTLGKSDMPKLPKEQPVTKKFHFYFTPQIDFGQLDYEIHKVSNQIKLISRLNPINTNEEITKFKKDTTYNPRFEYQITETLTYDLLQTLTNLKTDHSDLGKIFESKKNELINQIRLLEHIGSNEFSHFAELLYKAPTESELEIAQKMRPNYKYYKVENDKVLSIKKTAAIFVETLSKYDLNTWKVEFKTNMIGDCSVNKDNTIFIKETAKFKLHRVQKLIAHEIETHILTAENGKKQPYRIFQDGTSNYLETQEGLAIYNQELALNIYPNSYFAAGNMIATDIIINNSFAESYHLLTASGFGHNAALKHIIKTKRGLTDTSRKGGFTKQALYTRGALKIKQFVENGGKLEQLYLGKISIDLLPIIEKIPSINPPTYIPIWY